MYLQGDSHFYICVEGSVPSIFVKEYGQELLLKLMIVVHFDCHVCYKHFEGLCSPDVPADDDIRRIFSACSDTLCFKFTWDLCKVVTIHTVELIIAIPPII